MRLREWSPPLSPLGVLAVVLAGVVWATMRLAPTPEGMALIPGGAFKMGDQCEGRITRP